MTKINNLFSNIETKLDKLRESISDLKEERDWIVNSLLPKDEALNKIDRYVDNRASTFNLVPERILGSNTKMNELEIFKQYGFLHTTVQDGSVAGHSEADTGGILCYFFGDQVKEKLHKGINETDYTAGPPASERPAMIKEIDIKLWKLEEEEEKLIVSAEEVNYDIPRRLDINPAVILEVGIRT